MPKQTTLPFNDADVTTSLVKLDSSGRARRQFRFWLDAAKPEEAALGLRLEELGKKRKFATLIKDAVRLMLALMSGDLSVLIELFPNVVQQIKEQGRAEAAESSAIVQFQAIIAQAAEAAANKTAEAIESKRESAMIESPAPTAGGGLKPFGGVKSLSAAPISPPRFDDEDDMVLSVTKADNTGSNAGANLIRSLLALQST